MNILTRWAMQADTLTRSIWHATAHRTIRQAAGLKGSTSQALTRSGIPRDLARLAARDQYAVQHGWIAPPRRELTDIARAWQARQDLIADAPKAAQRIQNKQPRPNIPSNDPAWFRHNFHHQEDGYLSAAAARLYDAQVEALFVGAGETMRRAGVAAIGRARPASDPRNMRALDLGCGAGSFSRLLMESFPRARLVGVDRSAPFLERCRQTLAPWRTASALRADAQSLPVSDQSCDALAAVFLFHEIPPKARANVFSEAKRVLKPNGVFVIVDSLQPGDDPPRDPWLKEFPRWFHEPYYRSYLREDFEARGRAVGLALDGGVEIAFLSRVMTFRVAR